MATHLKFSYALSIRDLQGVKDNVSAAYGNLGDYLGVSASGRLDIVEYLVNNGANVKHPGAMYCAATEGHLHIVKYLHERGAVIDICSVNYLANRKDCKEVLKYFLMNGSIGDDGIGSVVFTKIISSCLHELMTGNQIVPESAFLDIHGELVFPDEFKVQQKRISNAARFKVLLRSSLRTGSWDLSFKF